ncbi:Gfo/Idh/MocA family oxidoreductase [Puniceicoccaceae bacterium K14]|nr:Gfo/Idh/MocA family oxidoreductase [Puniceicoccaceae bacterium K14]
MEKLRFAIFGTGFWSNYQIPGWLELDGVECVAAYNRTKSKAQAVASKFGISNVYDDAATLLENEDLDFVDICTDVDTHLRFAEMAADKGLNVVCQKPLAASLEAAEELVSVCRERDVRLFANENFRWQAPLRKVKDIVDTGIIGDVFKVRISFVSAFPVFENQPFLADLDHFIVADVGSHILDVVRFLCGEAKSIHCLTNRINPSIKGEDVANCFMDMENGIHCFAEMSYASIMEKEQFPQTFVLLEGSKGSIVLDHGFEIRVTTRSGTEKETVAPKMYDWLDPEYALLHSSIVDTQKNILEGLRGGEAETTGEDNLKTVKLVWKAYESAETGKIINL